MATVLVVDDVATVRLKTRLVLEHAGAFCVTVAASGPEALQALGASRPDAIVLDYVMGEMDGPTTLRALRANGIGCPVVLYTARPELAPGEYAALGFDAAISKAASLADLITVLRRLMRERAAPRQRIVDEPVAL